MVFRIIPDSNDDGSKGSGHNLVQDALRGLPTAVIAKALTEGAARATYNITVPELKIPEIKIPDIQVPPLDMSQIGRAIQDALGSEVLQKPIDFLIDVVKQVSGFLSQIVEFLQCAYPLLRVVMNSFNEWNSLEERMKASGQDLSAPNLDPILATQVTALMAVPGVGQMVRGAVNYAHMARYQQMTGRGFATDLDQLYWLANGPAGAAAGGIDQAVSKIPAFFLR